MELFIAYHNDGFAITHNNVIVGHEKTIWEAYAFAQGIGTIVYRREEHGTLLINTMLHGESTINAIPHPSAIRDAFQRGLDASNDIRL